MAHSHTPLNFKSQGSLYFTIHLVGPFKISDMIYAMNSGSPRIIFHLLFNGLIASTCELSYGVVC